MTEMTAAPNVFEILTYAGQNHKQLVSQKKKLMEKLAAVPSLRVNLQGHCSIRTVVADLLTEGKIVVLSQELTEKTKRGLGGRSYQQVSWFVTLTTAK